MFGKIDLRLQRRGARRPQRAARRSMLMLCAALAIPLSSIDAGAAPETFGASTAGTPTGPSLTSQLGDIAGALYDKAQTNVIAPSRQAAEQVIGDGWTDNIYRYLSETKQCLVALVDPDVIQAMLQRSFEAVGRFAGDLMNKLRVGIIDPLIAGLRQTAEAPMAAPPGPDAAITPLAIAANPFRPTVAIPGLDDGDILRNIYGDDPLEPLNRLMFRLNGGLHAKLLAPVSQLYLDHTSAEVQLGIGNFFRNLREPATFVSSALEGQFDDAGTAAARFGINTTLGIAGLRDPATELGFTVRPRNFEETLCVYGLPSGPYLVLPVLGPATLRDAAGRIATVVMYFEVMGVSVYVPYRVTDITVQYANVKDRIEAINKLSADPYMAQKALYLTLRDLSCGRQALAYREFFAK